MTFDYDISFLWIYTISGNPKHLLMHDTQNHYQYLSRHLNIMIKTISNCGPQIDTTVKQLPKICPQNKARVCTKNSFTINNTSTSYYIQRFSPGLLVSQRVQPNFSQQLSFWFSDCLHFGNQRNIFKIDRIELRTSRSCGEPWYLFVMTTRNLNNHTKPLPKIFLKKRYTTHQNYTICPGRNQFVKQRYHWENRNCKRFQMGQASLTKGVRRMI